MFANIEYKKMVNLFHILVVAPFLFYLAQKKGNVDVKIYNVLAVVAVVIAVTHSYKYMDMDIPKSLEQPKEEAPKEEAEAEMQPMEPEA